MWWIALAFLVADARSAKHESPGPPVSVQCRAAAEIIRDVVLPIAQAAKRKIVFDQHNTIGVDADLKQHFELNPPAPPGDLLSNLTGQIQLNAVGRCNEVRLLLKKQQVRFDKHSVDDGRRLKRNVESRAIIYTVSMPALGADGSQALFGQSMWCGGRCGLGSVVHVSRGRDGKWVRVSEHGLWIS